ncbi:MAG: ATP-binding protein, partial [Bacteroidales bacterium]
RLTQEKREYLQRLEEEVKRRTEQFEVELAERQRMDAELKIALKKAEEAIFLKNAFLSNISHEIRTPLNGIIGFASLLETELSAREDTELYEYANGITQSSERLLRLLNNLIDISRVEAHDLEVHLESCDLGAMVSDTAELFRFKANEKGIRFNVFNNDIPLCLADPANFPRILSEVIDNALKYTERGFINISTGYKAESQEVFVRVKDTGVGIDAEYLPHIFDAFRQESLGFSRAYEGAGLGLPLARRIIELMNGRIEVESTKGNGTIVTLYLKAAIVEETSSTVKEVPVHPVVSSPLELQPEKYKILVVEDDRMNRMVLRKMLQNFPNLSFASDGDEALKIVKDAYNKNEFFNVVLMDINLPMPWDGIRLMKKIKEDHPEYHRCAFIAQTAYAMSGDRERFLEEGFDDYISKPIARNILLLTIEKNVNLKKSQND